MKIRKIIASILLLSILLFVGYAIYSLFNSFEGKKFLNKYFTNSERTINLINESSLGVFNYAKEISVNEQDDKSLIATGVENVTGFSRLNIEVPLEITNSTVVDDNDIYKTLVIKKDNGELYVQDIWDGSFSVSEKTYVKVEYLNKLTYVNYKKVLDLLNNYKNDNVAYSESEVKFNLELSNSELLNLYGISDTAQVELSINPNSYYIEKITISNQNNMIVDVGFEKFNQQPEKDESEIKNINKYGDYLARESVLVRTNKEGVFDYLWQEWEQENFGCTKCINKIGDFDGDGLINRVEFVAGFNPNREEGVEFQLKKLGPEANKIFTGSISFLSHLDWSEVPRKEDFDKEKLKTRKIRDSIIRIGDKDYSVGEDFGNLPLVISIEDPGEDNEYNSYVNLFFDDLLMYKLDLKEIEQEKTVKINISIENIQGLKGMFYIVMNSVGSPGDIFSISWQDKDGDGLLDGEEKFYGTDLENPDTDGDGFSDGEEIKNGFNPNGEGKQDMFIREIWY